VRRQGVDTVKAGNVHVRWFAEAAVGRKLNDLDVIELTTNAARSIGIKAFELDWRIWEASRGRAVRSPKTRLLLLERAGSARASSRCGGERSQRKRLDSCFRRMIVSPRAMHVPG